MCSCDVGWIGRGCYLVNCFGNCSNYGDCFVDFVSSILYCDCESGFFDYVC